MFKRLGSACCFALSVALFPVASLCGQQPKESGDWRLVWQDEFNGTKLDYSKWECEINAFGGGNQELQIYTDRKENVRVEGGSLVLEAHRAKTGIQGTDRDFSSGRIRSKHRGDWLYGRFEIRAKLPRGQGVWPAIWMLPTEDVYGPWAASGEIDIMEFKGHEPNRIWGTLHYGESWPKNQHSGDVFTAEGIDFSQDFHVYGLEWEAGEIRWYIDGKLVQTQKKWNSAGGKFPAPFDQPFHLIMNIAIGGGFGGPVAPETQFPQQMLVDYVRVYQRAGK